MTERTIGSNELREETLERNHGLAAEGNEADEANLLGSLLDIDKNSLARLRRLRTFAKIDAAPVNLAATERPEFVEVATTGNSTRYFYDEDITETVADLFGERFDTAPTGPQAGNTNLDDISINPIDIDQTVTDNDAIELDDSFINSIDIDQIIADTTESAVDSSALDNVASQAIGLYAAIQEAAIGFEIATAGEKLSRDKGKAVTG